MSVNYPIVLLQNEDSRVRWKKLSSGIFRVFSKKEKLKNFFGQPLDAEPQLPETGSNSIMILNQ
jgi:hypothetical protein